MYDRRCETCGYSRIDVLEPMATTDPTCSCGGTLKRAWVTKPSNVISDEIDIWIKHGLCNEDGSPRHYRFKSEIKAEAARRGLVNVVEHRGTKGGDRSDHTTRWI